MALYNVAKYGNYGTEESPFGDVYGQAPRLEYSVQPFSALAITYSTVFLNWTQPQGTYTKIRVVRGFDGYSETSEDGTIIWEWDGSANPVPTKITEFTDGNTTPGLPSGTFVYYRIWIQKPTGQWVPAGDTYTLIPTDHSQISPDGGVLASTHQTFMDLIPRVFTSASQSPIDEVDETSDLFKFIKAFSFTLDVIMTYADLLLPKESGRYVSPGVLLLQVLQLGLVPEAFIATKQQRRLAREALYIYQNKGTLNGLSTFVESITGFAPGVTNSPNLVITPQDSNFTGGTGFWYPMGEVEFSATDLVPGVTPSVEPYITNYRYVGKAVVGSVGARLGSGNDSPIGRGTPVVAGIPYTFSGYGKAESGTMSVTAYATWYDYEGKVTRVDPPAFYPEIPQSVGDTDWTRFSFTGRAPGVEQEFTSVQVTDEVARVYVTPYNVMLVSNSVKFLDITTPGFTSLNGAIKQISAVAPFTSPELGYIPNWFEVPMPGAADTVGIVPLDGRFVEAYPTLAGPAGNSSSFYTVANNPHATFADAAAAWTGVYYGTAGAVISGGTGPEYLDSVATIVLDSTTGLSVGDSLLIQGIDAILSFGHHKITNIDTGTNAVSFAIPGHPNGTVSVPGFAMKVVPNSGGVYKKAKYAGFEMVFQETGTVFLDLLQIATFDVAQYYEARSAQIFLHPTKSNFAKNPSFNADTLLDTWSIDAANVEVKDRVADLGLTGAGTALQADSYVPFFMGAYSITDNVATITTGSAHGVTAGQYIFIANSGFIGGAHLVTDVPDSTHLSFEIDHADTSLTSLIAGVGHLTILNTTTGVVPSGQFITSSFYVKGDVGGESFQIVATAYDALAAKTIASITGDQFTVTDEWQRVSVTLYVPEVSTPSVVINLTVSGGATGDTNYFDHVQVENAFKPTDYFDGDSIDDTCVWEGTVHASASHFYPNLSIKRTRLKQELPKYIPYNTSFLIKWYGGGVDKPYVV